MVILTDPPVAHRFCTFIMSSVTEADVGKRLWRKFPRWLRERTHGCWCSSWRLTKRGWRVWRKGRWSVPKRGELYQPRRRPLTYDDLIKEQLRALPNARRRRRRSRARAGSCT